MPGDFQSQSRAPAYIGLDRPTIEVGGFLLYRHRRPKRYPPRLGDAVEVTSIQIWAPLDPACLQKVAKQSVTHRDQLENRHPIALHKELQNFSLPVGRIWLHHSGTLGRRSDGAPTVFAISKNAIADAKSVIEKLRTPSLMVTQVNL